MVRILRCFDLLEAHIIVARLREDGIDARVFDADFVRQDWFKMLVYGGFRIMVPAESAASARQTLQDYQQGALTLADEGDRLPCQNCQTAGASDDPQPRRNVFLAIIVLSVIDSILLLAWSPSSLDLFLLVIAQIALCLCAPWLILRYFKWRMRCQQCGHRWREPPRYRYADLAATAEASRLRAE
jgi:Putative prokaryotic signal transducing protein